MPTLEWIGKDKVVNHHLEVPYRVLEEQYTYNADQSENMIIRGDNLEALKALLPRYEGKVKCIYIDPPYNTGNEGWVYNDNVNDPRIKKWLGEVVGKEGEDLSRHDKCKAIPATDWNEQTKAEEWRAAWAQLCNQALEQYGHNQRIDHRSYERQGIDQIPTVHLGVAASAMEKRGIRTERGDLNREIEVTNQKLRQLKARIAKLQKWLKEEQENTEPPTLADYIQGILTRRAREGKSQVSQSIYNLKDAAKMLNFLQANNIMDMAGLDEKFKSMIGEQLDIQHKLKPIDRRLGTLKKHIEQAEIYFKYKGKKHLTEAEQILFTAAKDYLKGVMNGKTTIPTKTWKAEYAKLTADRKTLNQRYLALKEEVREAEQIRKSVYSILRQEQREQPRRAQDMER